MIEMKWGKVEVLSNDHKRGKSLKMRVVSVMRSQVKKSSGL